MFVINSGGYKQWLPDGDCIYIDRWIADDYLYLVQAALWKLDKPDASRYVTRMEFPSEGDPATVVVITVGFKQRVEVPWSEVVASAVQMQEDDRYSSMARHPANSDPFP